MATIAGSLGGRVSEMVGLRWEDVERNQRTLTVKHSGFRVGIFCLLLDWARESLSVLCFTREQRLGALTCVACPGGNSRPLRGESSVRCSLLHDTVTSRQSECPCCDGIVRSRQGSDFNRREARFACLPGPTGPSSWANPGRMTLTKPAAHPPPQESLASRIFFKRVRNSFEARLSTTQAKSPFGL